MAADNFRLQDLNTLLRSLRVHTDAQYCSLIISIDLGTTYSGIGYVFTADSQKTHILDQWPGQTSAKVNSPKVPTVLKYGSGGPGFTWGYQVGRRDDKKLEAFKLLLDPSLPKPEYTQIMKVEKNLREFIKTPIEAINDFVGALYRYAIAAIEERHTQSYSEVLAVKFVVSTPTGWPLSVKAAILKAARDAGATPVTYITEAEAAACFSMQSTEAKAAKFKHGDTIIVCDAGGATTHITSYTIRRFHPLELEEFVPALTRAAGSLNLDKNFENHIMRNLFEEEQFIPLKKSPLYVETLKQFDQDIKPVFTSSSTRQFSVKLNGTNLTDCPDGKLRNNTMIFDTRALEVIFKPVANTVATCITEQINAVRVKKIGINSNDVSSVDAVILVGGFGANKYLREYLGKKFPNVKFIQPTNAWTAVIRGSILRHAPATRIREPFGSSTAQNTSIPRARRHYGITCSPIWDESVHKHEQKYWDSWEGVWRCKSIKWLIKKGDDLRRPRKFSLPCYKQCGPHPEDDDFFICVNLEQSTAVDLPETSVHTSISTNRSIRVPLDGIPDNLFHKKTRSSDGQPYWYLVYEIVLDVSNGSIGLWIEINRQQFGRVPIN